MRLSESNVEIKLLPVSENGRPPYWNSTSGFDFDLYVVIGMWFCFSLPNFVVIKRYTARLWRHIDFWRWRPWSQKSISGFRFSDGTCLRRWISICISNLDERSRCTAETKLLPILENEMSPYWNSTSGFDFGLCVVIGLSFCIHLPSFILMRRHIDFSRWRP